MFKQDMTKVLSAWGANAGVFAVAGGWEKADLVMKVLVGAGQFAVAVATVVFIAYKIRKARLEK